MPIDPHAAEAAAASADFWKGVITTGIAAGVGLLGVLVGGGIQLISASRIAKRQREDRLADDKAERERAEAKLAADRSYVRAVLARHLEAYAKECAEAMWENGSGDYGDDDQGGAGVPNFKDWPEVSWELLGANEMMKARDIALRVTLQKDDVSAGAEHEVYTPDDARTYYGNAAARLGLEAWQLATQMREEAGVAPFEFPPKTSNFARSLADHVSEVAERARKLEAADEARRAARRAAGEPEDDDIWNV